MGIIDTLKREYNNAKSLRLLKGQALNAFRNSTDTNRDTLKDLQIEYQSAIKEENSLMLRLSKMARIDFKVYSLTNNRNNYA